MTAFFKNRKIAAYIALHHHTRFIIPVMKKLESIGAEPLYIVGQAERSQEITAVENNLNYIHVFDYVTASDQKEVMENYILLRDGLSQGIKKDIAIGASTMLTVLDKNLFAIAKEYIGFRNFLKKEKPDLCFALHEVNRWGKTLSYWSKKMNTPFFSLQEGLTNASDFHFIGHVQYSTLNLVWGEKTRKKLIGFEAPPDRVIPVGNTHIANEVKLLKKNNTREIKRKQFNLENHYIVLLIFSAEPSSVNDLNPLFEYMSKEVTKQKLIIKFHPVTSKTIIEKWTDRIPDDLSKHFEFIHGEESTYDLMAASDLCVISEPSTTGLEALAIGKPLVQLKLSKPDQYPYDFVKDETALHLTPIELVENIDSKINFSELINHKAVENFINNELTDTTGAADRIIAIMKKAIISNSEQPISSISFMQPHSQQITWSIIIPVADNPDLLLAGLEAVSEHSEGFGEFEVILAAGYKMSDETNRILDSLEGDVKIIKNNNDTELPALLNAGAVESRGKYLLFFDYNIAPDKNWLKPLAGEADKTSLKGVFGARIVNINNNIIHAGMVVDSNNSPVPAYLHLDADFPHANKQRNFQMVNHFMGISRNLFQTVGGFNINAGQYLFLDLCLTAEKHGLDITFLPEIRLVKLDSNQKPFNPDEAVYFYSKWHGKLWESEQELYDKDGVSSLQLDAARMTRAMEAAGR